MRHYGKVFAVAQAKNKSSALDKETVLLYYRLWYRGKCQPEAYKRDIAMLENLPDGEYVVAFPQWAGHSIRFRENVVTSQGLCRTVFASQAVQW